MQLLQKYIEEKRKEMLDDCEKYHSHLFTREDKKRIKTYCLEDFLYDIELKDWEDIGFFIGYLRCLDDICSFLQLKK